MADYIIKLRGTKLYGQMDRLEYDRKTVEVEADTREEAIAIAKLLNENLPIVEEAFTTEEIEARNKARKEAEAERNRKEAERKAKAKINKEAKELEKAEALGLTLEEYREKVKLERKIKRYENEIAELEKELKWRVEYLKKLKAEA